MFTLFAAGMFMLIVYRAIFNAFLAVEVFRVPLQSWEDVLESQYNVILQTNPHTYELFSLAPSGTVFNKIFKKKIVGQKTFEDYGGEEGVLAKVIKGEAIYIGDLVWIYQSGHFPCSVIDIKYFQ